jgi:hypothetical protein
MSHIIASLKTGRIRVPPRLLHLAWSEVITFAVLNITAIAIATGSWHPRCRSCIAPRIFPWPERLVVGALGQLPRVKASTSGEGHERRYFYGSVWAVCWAQPAAWFLWKVLLQTRGRYRRWWSFSPFSPLSATSRALGGCRARGLSFRANWPCLTERVERRTSP